MEDMGLMMEMVELLGELTERVEALEARDSRVKWEKLDKPTVDEVAVVMREHCKSKGFRTDANPQEFVDFYESNGWKIGRVPMKDWEAAARNWCRRGRRVENRKGSEAYVRHGL